MLYSFCVGIPRFQNFIRRRFDTKIIFFLLWGFSPLLKFYMPTFRHQNYILSFVGIPWLLKFYTPTFRHKIFRRRGIPQKKECNKTFSRFFFTFFLHFVSCFPSSHIPLPSLFVRLNLIPSFFYLSVIHIKYFNFTQYIAVDKQI